MANVPTTAAAVILLCSACARGADFNSADSSAVAATQAAFVAAWLRDDTTAVLSLLDSNVVLLPPGGRPVVGHMAVRNYWWPNDGSRTRITAYDWESAEIAGSGLLAYARGMSSLAWTYDRDTVHQSQTARSQALVVLRRDASGRWLIARQMWSPAAP